jgi:DNA-binding IclR family transcriptional regulator
VAEEEGEPGTAALAAVIRRRGPDAAVVGTVSIAGPMARITPERYEGLARRVRAAAEELALLWPVRDLAGLREPQREEAFA